MKMSPLHCALCVLLVSIAGCDDAPPRPVDASTHADVSTTMDAAASVPDAPSPDAPLLPTDAAPATCGNGVLEAGEGCEPSLGASRACRLLSDRFGAGDAVCLPDCRWSLAACELTPSRCGNGVVEPGEACDPGVDARVACASLSPRFTRGDAACTASCQLDLSACVRAASRCGDGVVEGAEQCDDGNRVDGDDCGNDCAARVGGTPALFEGPPRVAAGASGAAPVPGSACASPAERAGARLGPVAEVPYEILLCETATGAAFEERDVRAHMQAAAEAFLGAAHVRLVEHGLIRFRHADCTLDFDSDEAARIAARAPANVVPIVFTTGVRSATSPFGIGGYAWEGGAVVTTTVAPTSIITIHELGHFFGLLHTHTCWSGREDEGNCAAAGDFFCDTPADLGPAGVHGLDRCDDGTVRNGACAPGCGVGSCPGGERPDRDNFMSYYHCWPGHFSAEQSDYMRCMLSGGHLVRFNRRATCSPTAEVCNGVDDDCDGAIDEGLVRACGSSVGQCRPGQDLCLGGRWRGVCEGEVTPSDEVCDGLDNDCDGATDEGVAATSADAARCPDRGVCAGGAARPVCERGRWTCAMPARHVADECAVTDPACGSGSLTDPTCADGVDNDCDGEVDEHNLAASCAAHPDYDRVRRAERCTPNPLGRCGRVEGAYACVRRSDRCGVDVVCEGATAPAPERCDGQDWDCNGRVDDRNDRDGDGYGDCSGRLDCNDANASVHPGANETCNGVDDDCDGAVDEGLARACASADGCTGGVQACAGGRFGACVGAPRRCPEGWSAPAGGSCAYASGEGASLIWRHRDVSDHAYVPGPGLPLSAIYPSGVRGEVEVTLRVDNPAPYSGCDPNTANRTTVAEILCNGRSLGTVTAGEFASNATVRVVAPDGCTLQVRKVYCSCDTAPWAGSCTRRVSIASMRTRQTLPVCRY